MKSLVALVGMKHRGTEALVTSLPQGEPLMLIREPDNEHDSYAVQVWARGMMIGFIKGSQVKPVALAMDSAAARLGLPPKAATMAAKLAIDGGRWPMVEIDDGP